MESAATVMSPSSEQRFWSSLRNRVDTLLDGRKRKLPAGGWPSSACAPESESGKRLREDSLLLIKGFDSVSSTLSQLTEILDAASQGARELAKPSLTDVLKRESQRTEAAAGEEAEPKAKSLSCASIDQSTGNIHLGFLKETNQSNATAESEAKQRDEDGNGSKRSTTEATKDGNLEKAKKLAISMSTKAASLARELKKIKSELGFVQERCSLLEEENKRLREGFEQGLRPEEDDLVRLQLETLLAEKSRLANENATLTRENQCLHQLVEYHQLTSQDLSESYEQAIEAMCLDFSPFVERCSGAEERSGSADASTPCTPRTLNYDFPASEGTSQDEKCK